MSGLVAIEGELNSAIQEYLEFIGFDNTLDKFNDECVSKGKSIARIERRQKTNQKTNLILNEMVQLFCHGERKEFFRRWLQNIPTQSIDDNMEAQKLEFEINIYFAVYPIRKGGKDAKSQFEETMASFKTFIETRGRALSQNTEYLPYFALPYVPNPQDNPGYQRIFSDNWSIELQRKLEDFLTNALKIQQEPRLVNVYSNQVSKSNNVSNLQLQLFEAEKRTMAYMKKFNKVQADYHNLIGITAELVDSLENTIRGQPVTSEYLQNICNRLFNSQLKQSIDFTRPGTAGEYIRQSLAYQKSNIEKDNKSDKPMLVILDYNKLKSDLKTSENRQKALILQALRWRLTKSAPGEPRDKVLESYISNDLLCLRTDNDKQIIKKILNCEDEIVKQYTARILNAFASLNKGRSYLATHTYLINIMEETLINEKEDTLSRQNLLAALQKLSLRRNLQTLMIKDDILTWLLDLLEDTETLSDYTLEYAVALLMNLCLRNAGNSNHEIRPYVNGALYSILSVPTIRAYAKKINLEDTLKTYLNDGNTEINTQIQFIINQINSDEPESNEIEKEDEANGDDDDEEDQDAMETDLDKTEAIKANPNELIGENLLIQKYSLIRNNESKLQKQKTGIDGLSDSTVLNRPTTPHQLRQSIVSQNQLKTLNEIPSSRNSEKLNDSIIFERQKSSQAKSPKPNQKINKLAESQSRQKSSKVLNDNESNYTKSSVYNFEKTHKNVQNSTQLEPRKASSQVSLNKTNNSLLISEKSKTKFDSKSGIEHSFNNLKIQNSVDQHDVNNSSAYQQRRTSITNSVNSTASSYVPKFSTFEPRPSSANSSKSRNSSSSGTATFSDHNNKKIVI